MLSNSGSEATAAATASQKAENEKRAAELRARLIEQKAARSQFASTASGNTADSQPAMKAPTAMEKQQKQHELPPDDLFSPERMIAEAKAAARNTKTPERNGQPVLTALPQQSQGPRTASSPFSALPAVSTPSSSAGNVTGGGIEAKLDALAAQVCALQATRSVDLATTKYPDLEHWLNLTGYHDVEYRDGKIAAYKQRLQGELEQEHANVQARLRGELEHEAASIEARLQELCHGNATNNTMPRPVQQSFMRPPPPVPQHRRNSSPAFPPYRGHSPTSHRGRALQHNPRAGLPLEHRITYPDRRSRSPDARSGNATYRRVRDASLERRQLDYGPPQNGPHKYDTYRPGR